MEMWKESETGILHIYAKNLPQFSELVERAEKEAQQLHQTLHELSHFTIDIQFAADEISRE